MATKQLKNAVVHKLTVQPLVGDTVLTWDSVSGWPTTGDFMLRLDKPDGTITEYVLCTSVNVGANQTTVTRAQEGTSASGGFVIGSTGVNALTAQMMTDALVRLDTALSQTLTGPLVIPTALGGTATATSYGSVPLKAAESLLGAPAASVSFTSIPATFRTLLAEWAPRGDTAAATTGTFARVNNDSAANYDVQHGTATGATASAAESIGGTSMNFGSMPANTATANYFGCGFARIVNYAGTTGDKVVTGENGYASANTTGTGTIQKTMNKWRTTATAINRLDHIPQAGNYVTGSLFTIWLFP